MGRRFSPTSTGNIRPTNVTTMVLANSLSRIMGRLVIDNTGLKGTFDYQLVWAPPEQTGSTAPSIFTALEEQLGLKLESSKGPVEVLVIDSVSKPSEN